MPSLEEMRNWNYGEAWEYFMESNNYASEEAMQYSQNIAKKCQVTDIRARKNETNIPEEIYKGGWLILIDGESCSGKTTIAEEIKSKYPDTVSILDIDIVCFEWIDEKIQKLTSEKEKMKFLISAREISDEYLKMEFENLVKKASDNGKKTVIIVGCFLETVFRAIIGTVLGKHFEKVAFFTVHEKLHRLEKYFQTREKEFGNYDVGSTVSITQFAETMEQYNFLEHVVTKGYLHQLGIGCDISFLIDGHTKLY